MRTFLFKRQRFCIQNLLLSSVLHPLFLLLSLSLLFLFPLHHPPIAPICLSFLLFLPHPSCPPLFFPPSLFFVFPAFIPINSPFLSTSLLYALFCQSFFSFLFFTPI